MSRRVSFSPDVNDKPKVFHKTGSGTKIGGNKKRVIIGIWSFRMQQQQQHRRSSGFSSPVRLFLRRVGAKVARALCFMSTSTTSRSSRRVSSSSSLARSRSYAESLDDSHRAEAIEDCIEFLNSSSSSRQRCR